MGTQHLDETERFRIRTLYFDGSFRNPRSSREPAIPSGRSSGHPYSDSKASIRSPNSSQPRTRKHPRRVPQTSGQKPTHDLSTIVHRALRRPLLRDHDKIYAVTFGLHTVQGLTQASFPRPPEKPSRSRSRVPANTGANAQAAAVTAEGEARPDADSHPVVGFHPGADSQDAN